MLWTILIVLLILALIGGLPVWPYARTYGWGWGPSGLIGVILIIVVILVLVGRL